MYTHCPPLDHERDAEFFYKKKIAGKSEINIIGTVTSDAIFLGYHLWFLQRI